MRDLCPGACGSEDDLKDDSKICRLAKWNWVMGGKGMKSKDQAKANGSILFSAGQRREGMNPWCIYG